MSNSKEYMRAYREKHKERLQVSVKEWKRANPDRQRAAKLKERYGITPEQYDVLLKQQGGGCAICGSKTPRRTGSTFLVVDHCHTTNKVRGLLCYRCNVGIGNFEDDPRMLVRAIEYLGGMNESNQG